MGICEWPLELWDCATCGTMGLSKPALSTHITSGIIGVTLRASLAFQVQDGAALIICSIAHILRTGLVTL